MYMVSLKSLNYCSSFDSFSLTLCTFKHSRGICTYLSSYPPRLHNKLDYVHSSRNLHVRYVHLGRNLYIHYVRLRPTVVIMVLVLLLITITATTIIHPLKRGCWNEREGQQGPSDAFLYSQTLLIRGHFNTYTPIHLYGSTFSTLQ